jgi:hypothetical protein
MPNSIVLATTESTVRWYSFDDAAASAWRPGDPPIPFTLSEVLDLRGRVMAGDKDTAKHWAQAMGLTNWRYVRL